ncbi:MAG: hypothetical protein JW699_04560 [Chitinispirillaceae bacterium]|nr:hypothetical protein [Chitinispirillaceae bacterium]
MNAPRTNTPAAPVNDDLLALIRAARLMGKHKGTIAPGTFPVTAGTIR